MRFFKRLSRPARFVIVVALGVLGLAQSPGGALWAGDVVLESAPDAGALRAGAAVENITPDVKKRAYQIGGTGINRRARNVLDPIEARALVLERGDVKIALVVVDLVGFMYPDVQKVRENIPAKWGVDYVMVASTHTHSAPDSIGIWSMPFGRDGRWMADVRRKIVAAIGRADKGLRPARLTHFRRKTGSKGFVNDTRKPRVIDDTLNVMKFDDADTGKTIATVVGWGNHPEAVPLNGHDVSADFPHFLREAVSKGMGAGEKRKPGLGGITIYWNASVGGLMTPLRIPVKDWETGVVYLKGSYDKAGALGRNIAALVLDMARKGGTADPQPRLSLRARVIDVPVTNPKFRVGSLLGILGRMNKGGKTETEVGVLELGRAEVLMIPGEIYPELVVGGVEIPAGHDFGTRVLERVPLKDAMHGEFKWVIGLANDELGYLLPYSQWDEKAPYTYGSAPYGEENSVGPAGGPTIYAGLYQLLKEKHHLPAASRKSGD